MARVLVTDGGPHSAEAYAVAAAEHLFQIGPEVKGDRLMSAKRLQLAIADAFLPHHTTVIVSEVTNLAEKGTDHYHCAHDHDGRVEAALTEILTTAQGTPWEEYFAKPETQRVYREEIARIWATAAEEEREWHAHRNPSEAGQAFLNRDRSLPVHLSGPSAA